VKGLAIDWSAIRTVLCLGAHCDDVEIGCGATLQELRARAPHLRFHWRIFSGDEIREAETRAAATALLGDEALVTLDVARFRSSYFPYAGAEIKLDIERLRAKVQPDLIFTHRLEDRHQDHRVVAELTWNAFRDHLILEYEIPKFEGDLGQPNVFVPAPREALQRKLEILTTCFPSQRNHAWFRPEVFSGLMALRGVECNASSGYAEAFHARKLVL
jgi:LmbE family N-acetylglucosaminyl deacetylase